MSLLTIVQNASPEMSIPAPASLVGNELSNAPTLLRLAREELSSLGGRYDWSKLTTAIAWSANASIAQTTANCIPADFDRMLPQTLFNRTTRKQLSGPISPEEWQALQGGITNTIDPVFRFRTGTILIWPAPTAGHTFVYEYVSSYKALSSGGVPRENWQADDDTCLFREDIVTLGLVWRYKKAKGRAYTDDQAEYERRVVDAIMRDGSKPRISSDAPGASSPRRRSGDFVISA
jgi:hypothetical protein